jgi:hypothetical protein
MSMAEYQTPHERALACHQRAEEALEQARAAATEAQHEAYMRAAQRWLDMAEDVLQGR